MSKFFHAHTKSEGTSSEAKCSPENVLLPMVSHLAAMLSYFEKTTHSLFKAVNKNEKASPEHKDNYNKIAEKMSESLMSVQELNNAMHSSRTLKP